MDSTTSLTTPARPTVLRYAAFDRDGQGGNPAGIVLDATGLDAPDMLAIAADVGYSETAFLTGPAEADGSRPIRYFAPQTEVAFCGHATVAAAVALAERAGTGELNFTTPAGPVTVHTGHIGERISATLTSPPTSVREAGADDVRETLAALRWDAADLDPALPPRIASAGNDHLVLAAASRQRLAALDYDWNALGELLGRRGWTTVNLVWREHERLFHARNPFPPGGVLEDPATGAAAAAFGAYLRELELVPADRHVTIHQGDDMGSPSTLVIGVAERAGEGTKVTGTAARISLDASVGRA